MALVGLLSDRHHNGMDDRLQRVLAGEYELSVLRQLKVQMVV